MVVVQSLTLRRVSLKIIPTGSNLSGLGLNYIHIPIDWDIPCSEQCLFILDLIDHLVHNEIVWLHCTQNMRVSCLMYLYRQFYMDMDMPTAQALSRNLGTE